MARIRSLHPGQWTDEEFVSCSAFARLLALGLRNEADDNGVFEWKPVGLKMRLFPADAVDIAALLSELVEFNQIAKYEIGGKQYGAIRNFCRYQRPKKPNPIHPISDEIRTFVSSGVVSSELDDDEAPPVPPKAEKSPQMKEEGGRMEEKEIKNSLSSAGDLSKLIIEAAGDGMADPSGCPSIALLKPLTDLLRSDPPCEPEDLIEGARFAGAWHLGKRGARTMKNWDLAGRKAIELRDDRLRPKPVNENANTSAVRKFGPADGEVNAAIRKALSNG